MWKFAMWKKFFPDFAEMGLRFMVYDCFHKRPAESQGVSKVRPCLATILDGGNSNNVKVLSSESCKTTKGDYERSY